MHEVICSVKKKSQKLTYFYISVPQKVTGEPGVQKSKNLQELTEDALCDDEVPTRSLRTSISYSTRATAEQNRSNVSMRRFQSTSS
jgi:hypothetical protein